VAAAAAVEQEVQVVGEEVVSEGEGAVSVEQPGALVAKVGTFAEVVL
jgi:hypothetical protein